jgi:hypothetical protein
MLIVFLFPNNIHVDEPAVIYYAMLAEFLIDAAVFSLLFGILR